MATQTLDTLVTFYTADLTDLASGTKRGAQIVDKFARQTATSLKNMGASFRRTGLLMTATITAPVVAGAAALVKLASDAEETRSKFQVVFRSVGKEAQAAAKVMQTEFFQSSLESEKLLSSTGDLLIGLGFTGEAALDMSLQVQKLGADLASFQNLEGGAEQASDALTKGILGESEALKVLGIAMNENLKKAQRAEDAANGLTFATEQQAKAHAVLQIALRQTVNAQGDLTRTQNSYANQLRRTKNGLIEIGITMGRILMPIALRVVKVIQSATEWFAKLKPEIRKNIVVFALVAAAVGPLLIVVGLLVGALGTLIGLGVGIVSFGASVIPVLASMLPVIVAVAAAAALFWFKLKDIIDIGASWRSFVEFMNLSFVSMRDGFREMVQFIRGDTNVLVGMFGKAVTFLTDGVRIILISWNFMAQGILQAVVIIGTALEELGRSFAAMAEFLRLDAFAANLERDADVILQVTQRLVEQMNARGEAINELFANLGEAPTFLQEAFAPAVEFFDNLPAIIEAAKQSVSDFLFAMPEIEMPQLPGMEGPTVEGLQAESLAQASEGLGDVFPTDQIDEEAEKIKGIFDSVGGSMIDSFSSGFAGVLQGTKSFGKMMKQVLGGALNQLLTMFIKHTIEKIALSKVETVGNAAAAAKHPWLIPLFVGVALAAFSAALGGVGGSSFDQSGDGGGGGVGSAMPTTPIAQPVSGITGGQSDVLRSMDATLGNAEAQTIIIQLEDDQNRNLASWIVRSTRDGLGDGTDRLALVSEVPA